MNHALETTKPTMVKRRGRVLFAAMGIALALGIAAPLRAQTCGDMDVQGDETCDDGNTIGGDGCAANCTLERRVTLAIGAESNFNVQGRSAQAYPPPGLPLSGSLTLSMGSVRASDIPPAVPVVIRAADVHIDPVALGGTACFCARPTIPEGFPSGIVAQGILGCDAAGLADVDYQLSQDHNIIDVDPECVRGTLQPDGHCVGPVQSTFTGGGSRGAATIGMGFTFYELGNCNGTPGDPDQRGCTADDPVSAPTQVLRLITGTAIGEIINADNTAATIAPGEACGAAPCDTTRTGSVFDCDALLAEPPNANVAVLAGIDVAVHLSRLDDLVTLLWLTLSGPIAEPATPTPTATKTPSVPVPSCPGDCDGDATVSIAELIRGVGIALDAQPLSTCRAFDTSGDGTVSVNELIQAVNASLNGCA